MNTEPVDEIVKFWFEKLTSDDWYRKDAAIDAEIERRFGGIHGELQSGVPQDWLATAKGYLAAILALDQFPRNMFRGDSRAFATDADALALDKRAIAEGMDRRLTPDQRALVYMPFQHSENASDQTRSVELFTALGNKLNLDFAIRHKEIIDRFGRFPHRNAMLGRASTREEEAFLKEPGSSF